MQRLQFDPMDIHENAPWSDPPVLCRLLAPVGDRAPALAEANDATKACWRILTTFEAEIHAAISGHTPDQFRFNFTSRNQLVNQVRDISRLLARNYWGYTRSNIPLNAFVAPALNVGRLNREFLQCDAPSPWPSHLFPSGGACSPRPAPSWRRTRQPVPCYSGHQW
jgi:hypothetical protein